MGVTDTIFALNGSSGALDDRAYELLGRLTSRGVAFNMAGQSDRGPFIRHGVPFVGQNSDLDAGNMDESLRRIYATAAGDRPGFHVFRIVLAQPGFMSDMTQRMFREHPERLYTVVSPGVLFRLMALHHGPPPAYMTSFIDDNLPTEARAGEAHPLEVTVRNEGFDQWEPGSFRLGVHVTREPSIAARSLSSDPAGYPHRFDIPHPVGPGEEVIITGDLPLPDVPGEVLVQLDMVHEGVTWFETLRGVPWQSTIRLTR